MNPQPVSRKRPAPGTSPIAHQPGSAIPAFPAGSGSQLSNDQFLQWGQTPPANPVNTAAISDNSAPHAMNPPATSSKPDVSATAHTAMAPSNQVARRSPATQLVSRNRPLESTAVTAPDHVVHPTGSAEWGEPLDQLYQRALEAKREAQAKRKQIPPFVQKLSSFLDESKNTDLIRWSDDGNSFIVLDEDEFAKTLIPELFKHNNYASFVRQLNMYGFHKKVGLSDNSMRASERKNKSPSEYANPYFKRGHPDLLWLIQKPKSAAGQGSKGGKGSARLKTEEAEGDELEDYGEEGAIGGRDERPRPRGQLSLVQGAVLPKDQLAGVYRELQAIRQQQQIISTTISKLRREHEQLYAQAANFQEQHNRHENSINAILTFLATVYNRSLQGQDGPQNLANSFAGVISQDQGNVVDVGDDYSLSALGTGLNSPGGPGALKKQPLLLKAPPPAGPGRTGRAATLSPSIASTYDQPAGRPGHVRASSVSQSGHVEELFDHSPHVKASGSSQNEGVPQRDIMSMIQNSNARNGIQTTFSEFPDVLSSLETSGGNVPLTSNERADMLRLMAHETNSADPGGPAASSNNALVSPTPPPMPHNYSGRLASTRAEIDRLMKMQAEQDRSVQNLTNLLQPLSPTGSIPGLGTDHANVPPPPLDLDQIFTHDYFTDLGDVEQKQSPLNFGDTTAPTTTTATTTDPVSSAVAEDPQIPGEFFDFAHLPGDGDLFDGSTPANQPTPSFFAGFDGAGYGASPGTPVDSRFGGKGNQGLDSGRIIETVTDSESTSPANTVDENLQYGGATNDSNDLQGGKGNGNGAKRRRQA